MASPIVTFKAGRLQRRGDTNWVDAQPTKGKLQLLVAEDGLLHFQWVNRTTSTTEEVCDFSHTSIITKKLSHAIFDIGSDYIPE